MKSGFLDKLIAKIGKVNPEEARSYLGRLVQERGFLEKVFDALQEGVIVTDAEGTVSYVNRAACSFFGLDPAATADRRVESLVRGLDWASLTETGEVVSRDMEIFYPENRYLNFYLAPLEGDDLRDERLGYVMIIHDITATRRRTEKKIESERMSALTQLAAGVAHEIGNPLNSLNIHLQLIERKLRKKAPEAYADGIGELLGVAREEIARLDTIVAQFLQAIRPTQPQREPADLNRLIREAVEFLGKELTDRGIRVKLELRSNLPSLLLDAAQMKQAFYNIIKNGMQAMGPDGELSVRSDMDDYEVTVTFADTGEGMDAGQMRRVFEPYYTTKKSGTGLGLLIVRRIVREHGGEIEINSRRHEGTRLVMHLPREQRPVRFLPPETGAGRAAAGVAGAARGV
jgi:PAS domain S-box-containing protein